MKKEALTLAQLASYDDLLTDALIDRVYFWTTIRKNRGRYSACRGAREDEITDILRNTVIVGKDVVTACAQLLELPGLKRYHERLSVPEREHFHRHMRKYVNIYLSDCPFEVDTTNRYTIDTEEAAAIARRPIHKGELIKYLSGIQVPITREEEKDLDLTRRDFSIVMSSRKRTPSLFLGPARFANHDCDANAKLTTKGSTGMSVVAAKDIAVGDEITVSYGDDYFGVNNCECLCATCEEFLRNGWAPSIAESVEMNSSSTEHGPFLPNAHELRQMRLETSRTGPPSSTHTPEISGTQSRKRKLNSRQSPELESRNNKQTWDVHERARVNDMAPSSCEVGQRRFLKDANCDPLNDDERPSERSTSPLSVVGQSQCTSLTSHISTAATSVSETTPAPRVETPEKCMIRSSSADLANDLVEEGQIGLIVRRHFSQRARITAEDVDSGSELSDLPEGCHFDDETRQIVPFKAFKERRVTRHALARLPRKEKELLLALEETISATNIVTVCDNPRRPGDYNLGSRLSTRMSSSNSCVECRVCSADFVQVDTYLAKWACPRCERHSKLYGYQWPKTDRVGKHDREARVLDHRTVDRFVWSDEQIGTKQYKRSTPTLSSNDRAINPIAWPSESEVSLTSHSKKMVRTSLKSITAKNITCLQPRRGTLTVKMPCVGNTEKNFKNVYDFSGSPFEVSPIATTHMRRSPKAMDGVGKSPRRRNVQVAVAKAKLRSPGTSPVVTVKSQRHIIPSAGSRSPSTVVTATSKTFERPGNRSALESLVTAPDGQAPNGTLKRPTRRASMGIAAAIAAEMANEEDEFP